MKYAPVPSLPSDRAYLHFEATKQFGDQVQVDYELVIPLGEVDCRGTFDHKGRKTRPKSHRIIWLDAENNRHIPMGRTMIGTSNATYPFYADSASEGQINLPFRDSAHCQWDNERLGNLPVFYSKAGQHWTLTPEPVTTDVSASPA